jgi:hypothetical protein
MDRPRPAAAALVAVLLAVIPQAPQAQTTIISDIDRPAPFNYGFGPGVRVPQSQRTLWNRLAAALLPAPATPFDTERAIAALPPALVSPPTIGSPTAAANGFFGPVLPWPIIPLHMILLPDGRVLNYGTDENGNQGAGLFYDLWDPTQPYETSQTVLPNTTSTDIFCSGMGLLPSGSVLITGGDLTINGKRNYSNPQANIFSPGTNTLTANGAMSYPRWYPADVPLPSGDHLIIGGRSNQNPSVPTTIPEYYSAAANSFTALPGAALKTGISWYYPKTFVTSAGAIDLVDPSGKLATLTTAGAGTFTLSHTKAALGVYDLPIVMYSPGQLLSIRAENGIGAASETYTFQNIDLRGAAPVVTTLPSVPGEGREWANMTVLADGTLLVNGGSGTQNVLSLTSYQAALYNPATQIWTPAATAAEPRLYHSAALLLPDGTVLTGGGGAPGPINELNAEIFYPPYLFLNDGSGNFAPRPVITAAPTSVAAGAAFTLTMADDTPIAAINLIRLGAVTHSSSLQTRFIPAAFTQSGPTLAVTAPSNPNDLLTGYWMIFVINTAGVPSVATIVDVPQPGADARRS